MAEWYAVGTRVPVGSVLGPGSSSLEASRRVDSPNGGRLEIHERIGPQADIRHLMRIQLTQAGQLMRFGLGAAQGVVDAPLLISASTFVIVARTPHGTRRVRHRLVGRVSGGHR